MAPAQEIIRSLDMDLDFPHLPDIAGDHDFEMPDHDLDTEPLLPGQSPATGYVLLDDPQVLGLLDGIGANFSDAATVPPQHSSTCPTREADLVKPLMGHHTNMRYDDFVDPTNLQTPVRVTSATSLPSLLSNTSGTTGKSSAYAPADYTRYALDAANFVAHTDAAKFGMRNIESGAPSYDGSIHCPASSSQTPNTGHGNEFGARQQPLVLRSRLDVLPFWLGVCQGAMPSPQDLRLLSGLSGLRPVKKVREWFVENMTTERDRTDAHHNSLSSGQSGPITPGTGLAMHNQSWSDNLPRNSFASFGNAITTTTAALSPNVTAMDPVTEDISSQDSELQQLQEDYPAHLETRLVDEYVTRASRTTCASGQTSTSRSASTGRFYCTLRCGYRTKKRGDWERHEKKKWPQEFWSCLLCRSRNATENNDDDHFVTHRDDKMLDHAKQRHHTFNAADLRKHSVIPYNTDFLYQRNCPFQGSCTATFTSWKERNDHIVDNHFSQTAIIPHWRKPSTNHDGPDHDHEGGGGGGVGGGSRGSQSKLPHTSSSNENALGPTQTGHRTGGHTTIPGSRYCSVSSVSLSVKASSSYGKEFAKSLAPCARGSFALAKHLEPETVAAAMVRTLWHASAASQMLYYLDATSLQVLYRSFIFAIPPTTSKAGAYTQSQTWLVSSYYLDMDTTVHTRILNCAERKQAVWFTSHLNEEYTGVPAGCTEEISYLFFKRLSRHQSFHLLCA